MQLYPENKARKVPKNWRRPSSRSKVGLRQIQPTHPHHPSLLPIPSPHPHHPRGVFFYNILGEEFQRQRVGPRVPAKVNPRAEKRWNSKPISPLESRHAANVIPVGKLRPRRILGGGKIHSWLYTTYVFSKINWTYPPVHNNNNNNHTKFKI